jgi:hypothetical protein
MRAIFPSVGEMPRGFLGVNLWIFGCDRHFYASGFPIADDPDDPGVKTVTLPVSTARDDA